MYQPLERATGTLKATIRGSENRNGKPVLLTNLKKEESVEAVKKEIMKMGNL